MSRKQVLTLERPDGTKGASRPLLRNRPRKDRPVAACTVADDAGGIDDKMVVALREPMKERAATSSVERGVYSHDGPNGVTAYLAYDDRGRCIMRVEASIHYSDTLGEWVGDWLDTHNPAKPVVRG